MSMVQDKKFPLLTLERSIKTPLDNEMVTFEVLVNGIKFIEFNKFKISLMDLETKNIIKWWKYGKKDETISCLELNKDDFIRLSIDAKTGTQIENNINIGNFLIINFNDSNYLKISIIELHENFQLKVELINFLAPHPLVNDEQMMKMEIFKPGII